MAYDKGTKFIRADKLIALLSSIPGNMEIECNAVGNLSIYSGPGKWRGFIDFNHEEVVPPVDEPDALKT